MLVRRFLFAEGFRYRLHDKKLPGKPDIILPKYKTAVFVHGCFWHGHEGCKYFVVPKTRTEWWLNKINRKTTLNDYTSYIIEVEVLTLVTDEKGKVITQIYFIHLTFPKKLLESLANDQVK